MIYRARFDSQPMLARVVKRRLTALLVSSLLKLISSEQICLQMKSEHCAITSWIQIRAEEIESNNREARLLELARLFPVVNSKLLLYLNAGLTKLVVSNWRHVTPILVK